MKIIECITSILMFSAVMMYYPENTGTSIIVTQAAESRISENGIELIKSFEGYLQYAVWDYSQWTIGYGTGVDKNAYPNGITEPEADRLLRKAVVTYEGYVQDFLNKYNISVNQNQYDALVSFTYNLGNVWKNKTEVTIRNYLINGIENYTDEQITAAFKLWCKAGGEVLSGLVKRREKEAALFLSNNSQIPDLNISGEKWRITSSTGVRLRRDSGTMYDIIDVISYSSVINVTEKKNMDGFLWGKTTYNGKTGWCVLDYAEHISGNINTAPDNNQNEVSGTDSEEKWYITSDNGVNLRNACSTSSDIYTVIPFNAIILVSEKYQSDNYTWGKTTYNGKTGWCVLDYAKKIPGKTDPSGLRIDKLPDKIVYSAGEIFDDTGMKVTLIYGDGSEETVTDYGCSGNTMVPGVSVITVEYKGVSTDFSVRVSAEKGDINNNGVIDYEDNYSLKKFILNDIADNDIRDAGDINKDGKIDIFDNIRAKKSVIDNAYGKAGE